MHLGPVFVIMLANNSIQGVDYAKQQKSRKPVRDEDFDSSWNFQCHSKPGRKRRILDEHVQSGADGRDDCKDPLLLCGIFALFHDFQA